MDRIRIHKDICELLHDTYIIKNSDYGNSFAKIREEHGNIALIHLTEKLERFKMLCRKDYTKKVEESIDDTLLDLANYAILELVEREADRQHEPGLVEEFLDEINVYSENGELNKKTEGEG